MIYGKYFIGCASAGLLIGLTSAFAAGTGASSITSAMKDSFNERGQAKLDRIDQDETQALCSKYATGKIPAKVATTIVTTNQATIKYPEDGQYLGSWAGGEKIAQTGVGFQYSDDPTKPVGGNCYACHQLDKKEIAYGTLGPSLYNYGKLRGTSEPILKYTWGKLYNAEAFTACSNMPRFGHKGILTEAQIKDVMALLLDPQSPVNQ
jgi:sulfur-oxidizing protein SoxX